MNVRIGINPLTWTNDDLPALGDDIPLDVCLAEAAAVGYDGVELGRKFPRDPAVLGPILEAHGLALVSGWYSLRLLERSVDEELVAMQPHFDLLAALGSSVMVCAEVTRCIHGDLRARLSSRPRLASAEFRQFAERLDELADRMQSRGMRLAYHHHMGTVIQSEAEVHALMAATSDAVGLLLDTGHLAFAGGDPLAVARQHVARVAHVHCKDVRQTVLTRVRNADNSFLEAVLQGVFTVPGDGSVDYAPIFAVLREAGYEGWLVVEAEQDPAIADPLTCATQGYAFLARAARG
ncbi:MAG TPA: myo-inosose-2 dehydratase [Woeseiaceae bacterium]|nr:myo-inosose-2 dehydratase [Woeseiaceae bacterium]